MREDDMSKVEVVVVDEAENLITTLIMKKE